MGKKTLTNAHCLLELIEKAPASILKTFSSLAECQALVRGFDWSQNETDLCTNLLEHIKNLRKEHRDSAEREALRVMRLTSPRGAAILSTVADQLHDSDLQDEFLGQEGGEMGRAIWMRTHSDDTARLFDVAETILNTGDIRGNKRLYDAFDVPCDDEPPPFIWNDTVKKELETQLTKVMRLAEHATRDALTGLLNRRALLLAGASEVERARRYQSPLTVVFLDLDYFKSLNDTRGHDVGDLALKETGKALLEATRNSDYVSRLGGDEFVVVFPEVGFEAAAAAGHKIFESVNVALNAYPPVRASVGVAWFGDVNQGFPSMLKAADELMFEVKAGGKNDIFIRNCSNLKKEQSLSSLSVPR